MAISTNQKLTIYRKLYENTGPDNIELETCSKNKLTMWGQRTRYDFILIKLDTNILHKL